MIRGMRIARFLSNGKTVTGKLIDDTTAQRIVSGNRGEIRRRLNWAGEPTPCFTTSSFCHQALLLFPSV